MGKFYWLLIQAGEALSFLSNTADLLNTPDILYSRHLGDLSACYCNRTGRGGQAHRSLAQTPIYPPPSWHPATEHTWWILRRKLELSDHQSSLSERISPLCLHPADLSPQKKTVSSPALPNSTWLWASPDSDMPFLDPLKPSTTWRVCVRHQENPLCSHPLLWMFPSPWWTHSHTRTCTAYLDTLLSDSWLSRACRLAVRHMCSLLLPGCVPFLHLKSRGPLEAHVSRYTSLL